MILHQQAWIFQ